MDVAVSVVKKYTPLSCILHPSVTSHKYQLAFSPQIDTRISIRQSDALTSALIGKSSDPDLYEIQTLVVRENQVKFIFLQFQVRFKARCLSVGCMGSCFHNKQILPGFGILKLINVNNQKELFSFRSRTDISLKRLLDYIIIFNRYANSF